MGPEWKTIDSAPKDGSVILARQGGYYPCHLYWKNGHWESIEYHATHVPTHWLPGGHVELKATKDV